MLRRCFLLRCFAADVRALKHKYRGRAQYADAQAAALQLYQAQLPTGAELGEWLNEERATAALNATQFFEISYPQLGAICEFARRNMSTFSIHNKLLCGIALCHADVLSRDTVAVDYKSFLTMDILPPLMRSLAEVPTNELQNVAKLLQRTSCHDEKHWSALCDEIARRSADFAELPDYARDASYMRIFAGTSRFCPTHPLNKVLLETGLAALPSMKSMDFSNFAASVQRLHSKVPQEPQILEQLLRRAGSGSVQFTCRDLSAILRAVVKIKLDVAQTVPVGQQRTLELAFQAAAGALEGNLSRFVDKTSPKYWPKASDVITVFFSLESADALAASPLLQQFGDYVCEHHKTLSASDTAIAAGVLRRTGYLQGTTVAHLCARAGQLVDEFHVEELAHIAATFAARREAPQFAWLKRAEERVVELLNDRTTPTTRLYLTVAFPNHALLGVDRVEFSDVSPKHVIDCLTLVQRGTPLWSRLVQELNRKFETNAPFTAGDVRRVSTIDTDGAVHNQGQQFIIRRLEEDQWRHDTAQLLPVLKDPATRATYLAKAVEQAERIFGNASPRQLEQAAELLVEVFGPDDLRIKDFVRATGDRLVQCRAMHPMLQFVQLTVRHRAALLPDDEWIHHFIFKPISDRVHMMGCANITRVLELLEARGTPVDPKFKEPVEVMVKRGIEAARGDEVMVAMLLATATRLRSGAKLPPDAITTTLCSSVVPNDLKAAIRGGGESPTSGAAAAPESGTGSRFSRKGIADTGASRGEAPPPPVASDDPLGSALDDEDAPAVTTPTAAASTAAIPTPAASSSDSVGAKVRNAAAAAKSGAASTAKGAKKKLVIAKKKAVAKAPATKSAAAKGAKSKAAKKRK